jgi:hypothetical protein
MITLQCPSSWAKSWRMRLMVCVVQSGAPPAVRNCATTYLLVGCLGSTVAVQCHARRPASTTANATFSRQPHLRVLQWRLPGSLPRWYRQCELCCSCTISARLLSRNVICAINCFCTLCTRHSVRIISCRWRGGVACAWIITCACMDSLGTIIGSGTRSCACIICGTVGACVGVCALARTVRAFDCAVCSVGTLAGAAVAAILC